MWTTQGTCGAYFAVSYQPLDRSGMVGWTDKLLVAPLIAIECVYMEAQKMRTASTYPTV